MNIDQKMIPPEVVEAAGEGFIECDRVPSYSFDEAIRAAIAAALAAWPGAGEQYTGWNRRIILPLPQEARDD